MSRIQRMPKYTRASGGGQPYLVRGPQSISMTVGGEQVLSIAASFAPKRFAQAGAKGEATMDRWEVTLTNTATGAEMTIPFSAGTGHRVFNDMAGAKLPAQPLLSSVIEALGNDAATFEELPRGDDKALEYLRSELGYETVPAARKILSAISEGHDTLCSFLSGTGIPVQDFISWSRSEQVEGYGVLEKGEFLVHLPEVTNMEGTTHKGALRIRLAPVQGGSGLTTALEPRAEDEQRLSVVASLWRKEEGDRFYSFDCSGPSMDAVRDYWSNMPEVAAAADLADRWHLNDMNAGTSVQNAFLSGRFETFPGHEHAVAALKEEGLLVDRGYSYGSQWLLDPLPQDVLDTVRSWEHNGLVPQQVATIPAP